MKTSTLRWIRSHGNAVTVQNDRSVVIHSWTTGRKGINRKLVLMPVADVVTTYSEARDVLGY